MKKLEMTKQLEFVCSLNLEFEKDIDMLIFNMDKDDDISIANTLDDVDAYYDRIHNTYLYLERTGVLCDESVAFGLELCLQIVKNFKNLVKKYYEE